MKPMISEIQILFLSIYFIGFIGDVFFIPPTLDYGSDLRLAVLAAFWLLIGRMFKFTSSATFKATLVFLVLLAILFTFFRTHPAVERVAAWVYIYLLIGIIQQFFEARRKNI